MFLTTETKRELTLEENRSVQMTIDYSYQCPLLKGVVYHMVQISMHQTHLKCILH